jgi:hypothetical protein
MITRQALIDIILQQQETINLLRDTERHNYRVDSKAIELTETWRAYWMKRAEKAEDELIDIITLGKHNHHNHEHNQRTIHAVPEDDLGQ